MPAGGDAGGAEVAWAHGTGDLLSPDVRTQVGTSAPFKGLGGLSVRGPRPLDTATQAASGGRA